MGVERDARAHDVKIADGPGVRVMVGSIVLSLLLEQP